MTDIDTRVRTLEIDVATQKVVVTAMNEALRDNTIAVQELTNTLNKSKGAWWALGSLAAAIGYVLSLLTSWVKGS